MKCTGATILCLLIATSCLAQNHDSSQAGFELGSMIRRTHIKAFFGHQIFPNWSIDGEAAVILRKFHKRSKEEEEMHKAEFDEGEQTGITTSPHTSIKFTYWPHGAYDGVFISTGGKFHINGKADCTLKVGYCMKTCSWLALTVQYGADLIASYRQERLRGDGIEICLSIIF